MTASCAAMASRVFCDNIADIFAPKKNILVSLIIGLTVCSIISAQETSLEEFPGLRERAIVMRIVSRIVEPNQEVIWDSENVRVTIPGRPVGLKLTGSDIVVAVQFTPFLRASGRHILVAQGQIWVNVPNEGVRYQTTMQTIPLEFREQAYFFPLGSMRTNDEAQIEIQLVLEPYSEDASENIRRNRGRVTPP